MPPWIAFKSRLAEFVWWIKAGAIAVLAGVILSVMTLFVGRRAGSS